MKYFISLNIATYILARKVKIIKNCGMFRKGVRSAEVKNRGGSVRPAVGSGDT